MTSFRLTVDQAFRFGDGSTVFIGRVTSGTLTIPSAARVLHKDQVVGEVVLSEERMPGPNTVGARTVVTRDTLDQGVLNMGHLVLEGVDASVPQQGTV